MIAGKTAARLAATTIQQVAGEVMRRLPVFQL